MRSISHFAQLIDNVPQRVESEHHMKLLFKKLVFTLSIIAISVSMCAGAYKPPEAFENDPLGYMEQEFIYKVDECVRNKEVLLEMGGAGVCIIFGILGGTMSALVLSRDKAVFFGTGIIIGSGLICASNLEQKDTKIYKYFMKGIAYSVLQKFLTNWSANKRYIPQEFYKDLQSIKRKYDCEGAAYLEKNAYKIVQSIRSSCKSLRGARA